MSRCPEKLAQQSQQCCLRSGAREKGWKKRTFAGRRQQGNPSVPIHPLSQEKHCCSVAANDFQMEQQGRKAWRALLEQRGSHGEMKAIHAARRQQEGSKRHTSARKARARWEKPQTMSSCTQNDSQISSLLPTQETLEDDLSFLTSAYL